MASKVTGLEFIYYLKLCLYHFFINKGFIVFIQCLKAGFKEVTAFCLDEFGR